MHPVRNIRDLFLKIGFVITLALSFNPVDTYAEPVVISLPVVEETEWVLEDLPFSNEEGVYLDLLNVIVSQAADEDVRETQISLFFRLVHYERLVEIQLSQGLPGLYYTFLKNQIFLQASIPDPEYEEWFIA
ncbi:MAG: hypothetical protein DWQ02_12800 [Bacteroidetes bacterium]|nr:MAG: hypothetical protein DWQ02_12800 [Bacteroidota bacterium]